MIMIIDGRHKKRASWRGGGGGGGLRLNRGFTVRIFFLHPDCTYLKERKYYHAGYWVATCSKSRVYCVARNFCRSLFLRIGDFFFLFRGN